MLQCNVRPLITKKKIFVIRNRVTNPRTARHSRRSAPPAQPQMARSARLGRGPEVQHVVASVTRVWFRVSERREAVRRERMNA